MRERIDAMAVAAWTAARRINRAVLLLAALTGAAAVSSAPADLARGLSWLQAQVQLQGQLASPSKVAQQQQARCETATTLLKLSGGNAQIAALVASLQEPGEDVVTESQACWQQLRQQLGETILANGLEARRVGEMGYAPEEGGHVAGALDTGWALASQLQNMAASSRTQLVAWLAATQRSDGSFAVAGGGGELMSTAVVLRGLRGEASVSTTAAAVATKAAAYLLGKVDPQGHWFDDVATTAAVFEALHPFAAQAPELAGGVQAYLLGRQQADGSWQGDPYVTAVALRALALTSTPSQDPTRSAIKVKFIDARTAVAVPNVRFEASSPALLLTSDQAGVAQAINVNAASYQFVASASGYATVTMSATLPAGQLLDLGTIQLMSPLGSAAVVSGTVREQGSNTPIAGAVVSIEGQGLTATSGLDGSYLIAGVAPGSIVVSASRAGYLSAAGHGSAQAGQVLNFSPWLSVDTATSTGNDCKLIGTVLAAATQAPVVDVTINLSGANNASITTDSSGRYQIGKLVAGPTTITAAKTGYDAVVATTELACSQVGPTAFDFSPRLYASNQSPADANRSGLAGKVMDAATNQPIAGAELVLTTGVGTARTGTTAVNGTFEFAGLEGPSATLQVRASHYQGTTASYVLSPLQTLDIGQVRLVAPQVEQLLPDLKVLEVKRSTARTDAQALALTGAVQVQIANVGTQAAPAGVDVTAFADINGNSKYDPGIDSLLGTGSISSSLAPGATTSFAITVQGVMAFRDAPVHVVLDPGATLAEADKMNNVGASSASALLMPQQANGFNPRLKWQWSASSVSPLYKQVMMTPVVGRFLDTNGDGLIDTKDTPCVIFTTFAGGFYGSPGVVRVLDGRTGQELMNITDATNGVAGIGGLALADLDGDGKPELIGVTSNYKVIAFRNNGTRLWVSSVAWSSGNSYDIWAAPAVADLDADGSPEILVGRSVFNADGTLKWKGTGRNIGGAGGIESLSLPIAADLFNTGQQNVIVGGAVYTPTGQLLWEKADGFTAVADFDGTGQASIIVSGNGFLTLYSRDGVEKWRLAIPGANGGGGAPTIADADNDGKPDIGVAGAAFYSVFRGNGALLWSVASQDNSSRATGSTFFDFEADGASEVLYADEAKMRAFRGTNGQTLWTQPNPSGTAFEYPLVVDTDADGRADLVVAANNYAFSGTTGVRVYQDENNAWVGVRSVWNQHAYSITNINDDLTVPRVPVPSWLSHNTFRLNKRVDGDPRAVPDLTVGYLRVSDGGALGSTLTVRVGNAGSYKVSVGTKLAVYSADPALGQPSASALVGTATLASELLASQWLDVNIATGRNLASLNELGRVWVVGDDDGAGKSAISDFDRTNNTLAGDLPAIAANLIATVSTNKALYTEADQAVFTVVARNAGSFAHDTQVRFTVLDAWGQVVEVLPLSAASSAPAAGTVSVAGLWSVAGILSGNYQVRADLLSPTGFAYGSALAGFVVTTSNQQANGTRILTDRVSYSAAQSVQLNARATNLTSNVVQENLRAVTEVRTESGQGVFSQGEAIPQLTPGGQRQYSYSIAAAGLAVGNYAASVQLFNAQGSALSQSTTTFSVLGVDQSGLGLTGQLQAVPSVVLIGQPVALNLAAANNGDTALSNVPITVRVVEPNAGVLIASISAMVSSWPEGATKTFAWVWSAQGQDGQTLVAAASANIAGRDVPLGQANIRLVGVPLLKAEPAQLDFAAVNAGETSVDLSATLSSIGTSGATALNFALQGADPSHFVVPAGGCSHAASLPIGGTCTLTVSYRPSEVGNHKADVRVSYANGQDVIVKLAGQAKPIVLAGSVAPAPAEIHLGEATSLTWSVSNPATVSLTAQLSLDLVNGAGQNVASWPLPVAVGASATLAGNQNYTATGVAQTLTAVLSQLIGTSTSVLSTATLVISEVPVNLAGAPRIKGEARILVLASCPVSERDLDQDNPNPSTAEIEEGAAQNDIALCTQQRGATIGAYLDRLGIVNKVVTTTAQFKEEMRCGIYNTYWLSGGAAKLDRLLVRELRDAIWRGEGLIMDGEHDTRNQLLHPVAGVKYQGKLPYTDLTASIAGDSIYASGPLASLGQPSKFDLLSGQSQGLFTQVPGNQGPVPAIVANRYGAGNSLLFAFNLAAMLHGDPDALDERLKNLVVASADRLASSAAVLTVGDVTALSQTLANQASAPASVQVVASLPTGLSYSGSNIPPTSQQGNTFSWSLTIAAQASQELVLRVRAEQSGEFSIPVTLYNLAVGGQTPRVLEAVSLPLSVSPAAMLLQAPTSAVKAIAATTSSDQAAKNRVVKAVGNAQAAQAEGQYQSALAQWVAASEALLSISSADIKGARDAVALGIEVSQDAVCQVTACIVGSMAANPSVPLGDALHLNAIAGNSCTAAIAGVSLTGIVTNRRTALTKATGSAAVDLGAGHSQSRQLIWQPQEGQALYEDWLDSVVTAEWQGQPRLLGQSQTQVRASSTACHDGWSLPAERFSVFAREGMWAKGGKNGNSDWEWGLGSATGLGTADFSWQSGKTYSWKLGINASGQGSFSVYDGATLIAQGGYANSAGKLHLGRALRLGVSAAGDVGGARIAATITSVNGQATSMSTATDGPGQDKQAVLYQSSLLAGLAAQGTLRMDYSTNVPPQGNKLLMSVQAGDASCQ